MVRPAALAMAAATAVSITWAAPPEDPTPLGRFVVQGNVVFAAAPSGAVACWRRDARELRTWDAAGEPTAVCPLTDPRLPLEPNLFAFDGTRALLSYFDFVAGSETLRRGAVIDTAHCSVEATFSIPGVAHAAATSRDGWLVLTRDPFQPGSQFLSLDRNGKITDAFTLDREFEGVTSRRGFDRNPLNYLGNPVVAGNDLWIIPHGDYELWYPPQHGRSFRRVEPPGCLAAHGRELRGEASAAHVLARAKGFPEQYRAPLEASIRSGAVRPTVLSATAGFAVHGHLLAVKVMDDRLPSGARIDVWDLATESVVAVLPFEVNMRLLALNDASVWVIVDGQRIRSLPVPDLTGSAVDACAAIATETVAARAETEVRTLARDHDR